MPATWTVLGAGSILPRKGYGCSGYALRARPGAKVTLFDCGPGTLRMLAQVGIGLDEVERVVVSHFHLDHCLDLFALAFARHNPGFDAQKHGLELVGPVGLAALLARGEGTLGSWAKDPRARVVEVPLDGRGRGGLERADLALACAATGHTPEALAWRAELEDGATLAYSGDSGEVQALAELAAGVDLFVCECSHPDGQGIPGHLTPSGAGRLARAAGCRRLLLTHFYPAVEPGEARARAAEVFGGPVEAAADGSVHPLRNGPR